jgi:DNA-binding CsgD family transcriptional regulator
VLGIIATRLAEAPTVDHVLETTAGLASRAVASRGQAVYLLDGGLQPTRTVARDLSDRFLGEYERFGRADDPLMDLLVRRRTAVTEGAPAFSGQDQLTALALSAQTSVALARCEGTPVTAEAAGLTPSERELLGLLGQGLRNREIAQRRGVSEHAVHQALKRLYRKLGVRSRAAAVACTSRD